MSMTCNMIDILFDFNMIYVTCYINSDVSLSIPVGSTIPICQFELSLVIFGPMITLWLLMVFYIYVDGSKPA